MTESKQYQILAEEAVALGREVLKYYFGRLRHVQKKDMAGLVSEADLESERQITEFLKTRAPQFEMLAEEAHFQSGDSSQDASAGRWILDPLDGTTNYVHCLPIFCISLGLEVKGQMQVGVIDVPLLEHRYSARRGGGAWKNGEPIQVSHTAALEDTLLATGFFNENVQALESQLQLFSHLVRRARGVRRLGAAAYDLCMVAEGVFDAFWEKNLSPWDTAAGSLLVNEAGGMVTNYQGSPFEVAMNSIVASNGRCAADLLAVISQDS